MIYLTTNQTLLQLSIPDELRGRVTAVVSLTAGLSPLGSFVAGTEAQVRTTWSVGYAPPRRVRGHERERGA